MEMEKSIWWILVLWLFIGQVDVHFFMKKYLCIFFLHFFWITPVFSAELFFELKNVGEKNVHVDVFLNTQEESVNAVEGTIGYDSSSASVERIHHGNSLINFWIESPQETGFGSVKFSGMTPGGFSGKREFLFSFLVGSKNEAQETRIFTDNIRVLKNDGKGTLLPFLSHTVTVPFLISTASSSEVTHISEASPQVDTTPPESFFPLLSQDKNIFDGKWFVSFSTQDKGFGISHYEVCEKGYDCVRAQSPFVLKNQTEDRDSLFIKAFDMAGNVHIEKLNNEKNVQKNFFEKNILIFFLIFVFFGILAGLFRIFFFGKKYGDKK